MANTVKYMKTNWRLLNRDGKSWIGHIFILVLLSLIPIVGAMLVIGYSYRWAKRTAWGMHTSPNQDGLKLKDALGKGWLVFLYLLVVGILWGIIFSSLQVVVGSIPVIGILVSLFVPLFSFFVDVIFCIAALRVAIYDEFKAGFMFPQIFDLCARDWSGILKITGIRILFSILTGAISLIFVLPLIIGIGPMLFSGPMPDHPEFSDALMFLVGNILSTPSLIIPIVVGGIMLMFISIFTSVFTANLCGIWMAQFYPECWGSSSEYVPINPGPVVSAASSAEYVSQVEVLSSSTEHEELVVPIEPPAQDLPEELKDNAASGPDDTSIDDKELPKS